MKSPQINLDTVKEVLKKLSFLKNNLALLVPIIIALVAALLFIPTKLLSARLKKTITQQSVKSAEEIERLIKDVNEAGQAEAMEEYVNAYAQDANQIENLMRQTTMRELFSYEIFPDTNETSPLLFDPIKRKYMAGVDAMVERIGGGAPPTDSDIDAALEQSPRRSLYGRSRGGMGSGYGGGQRNFRLLPEMDRRIVDKLCEDRAKAIRIYANPADLDGYSFWSDWTFEDWDTAVRQSWTWQMGYWALGDVIDTIQQMNSNSSSALDAPVKRIMNVSFTLSSQSTRMIGGRRGRMTRRPTDKQTPTYVINLKTAIAAPPCTGRYCNEIVDVMHFNVRVIVAADQVMPFIQELCSAKTHKFRGWYGDQPEQTFKHNQIAVLESNVIPVDIEDLDHNTYRYGSDTVVDLDLICEYIFQKAGYEAVKPQVIKNDIAGTTEEI